MLFQFKHARHKLKTEHFLLYRLDDYCPYFLEQSLNITLTHDFITFNILLHIQIEPKLIQKLSFCPTQKTTFTTFNILKLKQ